MAKLRVKSNEYTRLILSSMALSCTIGMQPAVAKTAFWCPKFTNSDLDRRYSISEHNEQNPRYGEQPFGFASGLNFRMMCAACLWVAWTPWTGLD